MTRGILHIILDLIYRSQWARSILGKIILNVHQKNEKEIGIPVIIGYKDDWFIFSN